jgi:hypothetical protein
LSAFFDFQERSDQAGLAPGAAGIAQTVRTLFEVLSPPLTVGLSRQLQAPGCFRLIVALVEQLHRLEIPPYAFCRSIT